MKVTYTGGLAAVEINGLTVVNGDTVDVADWQVPDLVATADWVPADKAAEKAAANPTEAPTAPNAGS